jgi:hypothetical protein
MEVTEIILATLSAVEAQSRVSFFLNLNRHSLWLSLGGGGRLVVYLFYFCLFLLVALFFVSFLIYFDETDSKQPKMKNP